MAEVLLVDTNFSSIPIYDALLRAGHIVHVVGGNPEDALAKISPDYTCLDYSDTDALREFVLFKRIEHLVPGCTDRSYESCVAIGQDNPIWGGDGLSAHVSINNKAAFKRVADRLGLPVPSVFSEPKVCGADVSVIIKPVDSFSGKGMTVLHKPDITSLATAVAHAQAVSPSGEYLIEQFVEGQLYSHSAFLCSGKVIRDFIVQEDCTAHPFTVDTSRLVNDEVDVLAHALRDCVETLAKDLCLADGLLHTQFIHDGYQFWLLELTRRCPGDLYGLLIEMSTGFPYAASYAAAFMGNMGAMPNSKWSKPVIRHTVSAQQEQAFASINFRYPTHIERYVPIRSVGDGLRAGAQGRVGVMFCREAVSSSADQLYQAFLRRQVYEISAGFGSIG